MVRSTEASRFLFSLSNCLYFISFPPLFIITDEKRNQIFAEFNSLAVIYGMPSVQFIAEQFQQVRYFTMRIYRNSNPSTLR